jgi:hypothetical protein
MSAAPQPAPDNSSAGICWPLTNRLTDDVRTLYEVLVMLHDGALATEDARVAEAYGLVADVVRIILTRQISRN